ncbi:MAG: ABC transporter permease [Desulfobacterales bacterium]|jgi:peptide/nickel transport system permease protein
MSVNAVQTRPGGIFWLAVIWLAIVVAAAATADWWAVPAFDAMDWENPAAAPGTRTESATLQKAAEAEKGTYTYWLGTDTMGRDVTSRLVYGARVSLTVGLLSPVIGFFLGGILGCLAGYFRGRLESVIVAAMDVILAFPGIVLLLAISFYLGPSLRNLVIALGFLTIPAFSRVARAKTLTLRDLEFVQAARLSGAGNFTILAREIIPNVIAPMAAYALLVVSFMIMAEGALSFLGLGVPAPTPSWGGMIAEGREVLEEAPHVSMIPAGVMFLTVMAFNLIGDSLRNLTEKRTSQL